MNHLPQLFANRIANVAVTDPLVRLELDALAPPAGEGEKPALQSTQNLVMPVEGFLAAFSMLEVIIEKMVAVGELKPRPQAEQAVAPIAPPTRQRSIHQEAWSLQVSTALHTSTT